MSINLKEIHGSRSPVRHGKIFIHIGTHKTGSTSIQHFLTSNADGLFHEGILVPTTGRHLFGHHHVPWELRKDERLNGRGGYVQQLLDEMCGSSLPTAVISSEDFEYLSRYPSQLRVFVDALRAVGLEPVFLVFFRDRCSYLRSLSSALVNHGVDRPAEWYAKQLEENDSILVKKDWWFDFNRSRFVAAWTTITEAQLVAFDYDHCTSAGGVLPAFLEELGVSGRLVEASRTWPRMNVRKH